MTNWLFGGVAGLISIIIVILVAIAIYVPSARKLIIKFIVGFVVVLFVGGSAYCGIQVDRYLNAKGGIYGYVTGLLDINTVTQEDETLRFKLNNIVLTQDDGDEYSALIYPSNIITLEDDVNYTIYVNDIPLIPVDSSSGYIVADYTYTFYNDDMSIALEDTLRFNLSFDDYITTFKITTFGGQNAVNYWNNYFARNKLTVSIEEELFSSESDSEIIETPMEETVLLTYYIDDEIFSTAVYPVGTTVNVFLEPAKEDYVFLGWSLDKTNIIEKMTIKQNTNLYAIFVKEVLFDSTQNSADIKYIYPTEITGSYQIDLNEYFDFTFPKNVVISYELIAYNENVQGKWFANKSEISTGESIECIRDDYMIHWGNVTLSEYGILNISIGEDVPALYEVELHIFSVKAY